MDIEYICTKHDKYYKNEYWYKCHKATKHTSVNKLRIVIIVLVSLLIVVAMVFAIVYINKDGVNDWDREKLVNDNNYLTGRKTALEKEYKILADAFKRLVENSRK